LPVIVGAATFVIIHKVDMFLFKFLQLLCFLPPEKNADRFICRRPVRNSQEYQGQVFHVARKPGLDIFIEIYFFRFILKRIMGQFLFNNLPAVYSCFKGSFHLFFLRQRQKPASFDTGKHYLIQFLPFFNHG